MEERVFTINMNIADDLGEMVFTCPVIPLYPRPVRRGEG
jgi:hypothetical protein